MHKCTKQIFLFLKARKCVWVQFDLTPLPPRFWDNLSLPFSRDGGMF